MKNLITCTKLALVASAFAVQAFAFDETDGPNGGGGGAGGGNTPTTSTVPDGGPTLALLGIAAVGLVALRRRFAK